MGSFDYTCCVSGLPIHAGDKVRYLLLTENPYAENKASKACYTYDWWCPRTFALRASYNDYGSVDEVEEGVGRELWREGLRLDLASRGVGDNTVHDSATNRDMPFDALLNSIRDGRVIVQREVNLNPPSSFKEAPRKTPKGIPTRQRVQKCIATSGVTPATGQGAYIVDNKGYGTVRVRWHGYGEDWDKDAEHLAKLTDSLKEYATVIRAGSGAYAHRADLYVYPLPGTEHFGGGRTRNKKPLRVTHAMIREDVWQTMLTIPIINQWSKVKRLTIDDYYAAVHKYYAKCQDFLKHDSKFLRAALYSQVDMENPVEWMLHKDVIPYKVAIGTHWRLFVEKNLPFEEAKPFLDMVAEMVYVEETLADVRYIWIPSSSRGAQVGEFEKHAAFLGKLTALAKTNHARDRARRR